MGGRLQLAALLEFWIIAFYQKREKERYRRKSKIPLQLHFSHFNWVPLFPHIGRDNRYSWKGAVLWQKSREEISEKVDCLEGGDGAIRPNKTFISILREEGTWRRDVSFYLTGLLEKGQGRNSRPSIFEWGRLLWEGTRRRVVVEFLSFDFVPIISLLHRPISSHQSSPSHACMSHSTLTPLSFIGDDMLPQQWTHAPRPSCGLVRSEVGIKSGSHPVNSTNVLFCFRSSLLLFL